MPKLKPKDFLINWVPGGVGPRRRQLEILAPGGAAVEPVALVRPGARAPLGHAGGEGALGVVLALPGAIMQNILIIILIIMHRNGP